MPTPLRVAIRNSTQSRSAVTGTLMKHCRHCRVRRHSDARCVLLLLRKVSHHSLKQRLDGTLALYVANVAAWKLARLGTTASVVCLAAGTVVVHQALTHTTAVADLREAAAMFSLAAIAQRESLEYGTKRRAKL